ncbi:isochorismatase family protein [Snodgrassella alvi]|jgi:bifunctional isochorismate lyase / aryl carrier protein|uniref:isochorismatase n=1 Tax=Snodgrassella alvi TaxID=1196083 RepID=A0A855FMF6_9NEIS|nr:isochorismatase family protein [Snodgrassella alvi]PIT13762.1 isochorismatase [Snodgrassella alvi]PIT55848.1 isochorismatase [Snodgrassella alvi]PIT59291.1 isochorismatase [Snodgrassella alvi]
MTIKQIADYPMPTPAQMPQNKTAWKLDTARAVLLIHDMQNYFLNFYQPNSPLIQTLIQNLQALRNWATQQQIPVVYTAQPHQQNPQQRALLNDVWGSGITTAPAEEQKIVAALTPRPADIVLTKWRYSAFQRTDLHRYMHNWQRNQLIIGGVYAHIGCMLTAAEAFMQDIQTFFIADALADFSAQQHQNALNYVASCCGQVTTTAALVPETNTLTRSWLTQRVQTLLEMPAQPIDPEENLILYGLDSLRIMQFAAELKQRDITLGFEALGQQPSLNNWWRLIEAQLTASVA